MLQFMKLMLARFRQEHVESLRWRIAEEYNAYQRSFAPVPHWMCPNCLAAYAPLGRNSAGHRYYPACCGEPVGIRNDPLRHAVGKGLR